MMPHAANYLLIKETLDVATHIIRWLGMPGMVGLAMMEAYYEGMPWRSARQLALRADCSEDTARRKAEELVNCGRAQKERREGTTVYAIDPKVDYSAETPTLVEFRLEEIPTGTLLLLTESGFDKIPAHRRAEAFRMNEGGWAQQMININRHVTQE